MPSQEEIRNVFFYHKDGSISRRHYPPCARRFTKTKIGSKHNRGYLMMCYFGRTILIHRLVWVYHNGAIPSGLTIDHINQNKTDNRIENLRLVTHSENMKNLRRAKNNRSGVTGVSLKKDGSYQAYIYVDRKMHHLGKFLCLEEATSVRKEAERKFSFHHNHGSNHNATEQIAT
jgi:hypothetical protein